jgi:hypothetical protein
MSRVLVRGLSVAVVAVLGLSACGAPHLHTVKEAKRDLVGRSPEHVRQCMGTPLETSESDGAMVWRYSSAQPRDALGRAMGPAAVSSVNHDRACVFDVRFLDNRVVSVSSDNRAGWGFGSITNCSAVVENCV